MTLHPYPAAIRWTGNTGQGTTSYRSYQRSWTVCTPGKPAIECHNAPQLGGDPSLHNPEDLLIAALSACHMLWYLHLASQAGVVVHAYEDDPVGYGHSEPSGAGRFDHAILRPRITLTGASDAQEADAIHQRIHEVCFIARSVNFPISIEASYSVADD
ncbi:MAG: OsmC family protein [Burkholderiaceae bacterium]